MKNILYTIILSFLFSFGVFADSSSMSPEAIEAMTSINKLFTRLLAILGFVYLFRRKAIGGWLLLFYITLYFGAFILFISSSSGIINHFKLFLDPILWKDISLFIMNFLVILLVIFHFISIMVATILLFRRNEKNLKLLLKTFYAILIINIMIFATNILYSWTSYILITTHFFVIATWTLYFLKSRRVQMVFVDRNWVYPKK